MRQEKEYGPVVAAGVLIGASLGGLIDSILFRQVIGAHYFLSTKVPIKTIGNLKTSLQADGILQIVFVLLLVGGIVALFKAGRRADVPWSGQLLFGSWFLGWGLFAVVEGVVSHHIFKLHHLLEYGNPASQETGDYAYLIGGVLLAVLGYWAIASSRNELEEQERNASREVQRAKEVKGDRKVYLD